LAERLGLLHHLFELDGLAAAAFAFVVGFDEGADLERFFFGNRRLAAAEELDDFDDQRPVAGRIADRAFAFFAHRRARVAFVLIVGADAAADPLADDFDLALRRLFSRGRLAAGAHHREQRLDAVNAVPIEIRMRLLQRSGAGGPGTGDLAQ